MRFAAFLARTFRAPPHPQADDGGPGDVARSPQRYSDPSKDDPRRQPFRVTAVVAFLPLACRLRSGDHATPLPVWRTCSESGRLRRLQGLAPSSGPVARSRRCRRDHGSVLPWASFPFKILLMVAGAPCSHHPPRHGRETMPRSSVLTPAGAPRRRVACRPPPSRCQEDVGCCARWASTWTARATAEAIAESEVSARTAAEAEAACLEPGDRAPKCTIVGPDSVGIPLEVHTRACIRRAAPTGGRSRSMVRPAPAVARGVARCLQSLSGAEVASGSCSELPRNRAGARRPSWGF
jgi:hypothetical protein